MIYIPVQAVYNGFDQVFPVVYIVNPDFIDVVGPAARIPGTCPLYKTDAVVVIAGKAGAIETGAVLLDQIGFIAWCKAAEIKGGSGMVNGKLPGCLDGIRGRIGNGIGFGRLVTFDLLPRHHRLAQLNPRGQI